MNLAQISQLLLALAALVTAVGTLLYSTSTRRQLNRMKRPAPQTSPKPPATP